MKKKERSLSEKCRQLDGSENYQTIKNFIQVNKEDIKLEDHIDEFKSESRKYAEWVGVNFGVNAKR